MCTQIMPMSIEPSSQDELATPSCENSILMSQSPFLLSDSLYIQPYVHLIICSFHVVSWCLMHNDDVELTTDKSV